MAGKSDGVLKAWLGAMAKAGKIKPGGRLVFINKNTGSALPVSQGPDNVTPLPSAPDPVMSLRSQGMVLGRKRKAKVRS